jgi:hypothetical protein
MAESVREKVVDGSRGGTAIYSPKKRPEHRQPRSNRQLLPKSRFFTRSMAHMQNAGKPTVWEAEALFFLPGRWLGWNRRFQQLNQRLAFDALGDG